MEKQKLDKWKINWGKKIPSIKIKVIFYLLTLSQLEKPDCSEQHIHNTQIEHFIIVNHLQNVSVSPGATIVYKY